MSSNIRGSSVALNEVLDVTIDDICHVISLRPIDLTMCRERLTGLMRSVVRMWQASTEINNTKPSSATNRNNNNKQSSSSSSSLLQPPPPRLIEAVPNLIDFLMHVSNIPNADTTAENMVWNLLFRLLIWAPVWPQRVANAILSRLYFFLHSSRRQLDRLSDAQERIGTPKWLYDVRAQSGAPVDTECAIWVTSLILFKLPAASVRVMLAPPFEQSSPQTAPFIKVLRKIAVDISLFCVSRVRSDVMPSSTVLDLQTFPVPALNASGPTEDGGDGTESKHKAFSKIPLEAMWILGKTMRTAAVALHDGVGANLPDVMAEMIGGNSNYNNTNNTSSRSNSSMSRTSVRDSNAAQFLFDLDDRDEDDDRQQSQRSNNNTNNNSRNNNNNSNATTTIEDGYRAQSAKEHGRSLCCLAAWLGGLRVLSSVVHTVTFDLFVKRPDSEFAMTSEEIQEIQAKPLFRQMGASPGDKPDEDFGTTIAMLVRSIVKPRPYRAIVLNSVAQLSRCAVILCAIDGLSRSVRGRTPHPGITRAAFELLAAGIHHPKSDLLEHSLTQALAEIYMMHKAVHLRYFVSVADVGCIVARVLDITTEFEAALRTAYPSLFALGHPYYEGWQQVVRVVSWLNDTCVDDKPRRGEPLWQLSLYFLRHSRADQEADPVERRFGTRTPNADEYFAQNSAREFLALREAEQLGADSQDDSRINEKAFDFTSALHWCDPDEWEEQMDRIELVGSVRGSKSTLNAYLRAQEIAVDRLADSQQPTVARRDAAFRKRIHRLLAEQRTVEQLVKDGRTSFATTFGGYKPSPSMAASLCFFNEILEWCFANSATEVATDYSEAYVGVIDNLSGHAAVAASISSGLLQLHAMEDKKKSALMTGLQAEAWCLYRICDLVEGARLHSMMESLFAGAQQ
jgi:hypothetical protein